MRQGQRAGTFGATRWIALAGLVGVLSSPSQAAAQAVLNPTEQIAFTRPEAWALEYFSSATLLNGLEPPRSTQPGAIAFGLEVEWLPSLNQTERRVGFDGTKVEDLNKAPFFLRPRVILGLPGNFSLVLAFVPPVRTFGLEPKLFAVALERPLYDAGSWSVGLRGYAQAGTVEGAYTCPASVLSFLPGSPNNPYGCQAVSSDTATLRYAGGEVTAAYRPLHRLSPHVALAVNYLDVGFQVNALTFGYIDHTHLIAHGPTVSPSAGVAMGLTPKLGASIDVSYVPLWVRRAPSAAPSQDGFGTIHVLLTYRLR